MKRKCVLWKFLWYPHTSVNCSACRVTGLNSVMQIRSAVYLTYMMIGYHYYCYYFIFEFPCTTSLYYIKNQQDATLVVLFISHCKITLHVRTLSASIIRSTKNETRSVALATDLGRPYWIYIILTHDMHQWLLLQFLVLLMMDAESFRNM